MKVNITNLNSISFTDLWYVANPGNSFGNIDGFINGQIAMKIDKVGANQPLLFESISADGIFDPGETWTFKLSFYYTDSGLPPSAFGEIGAPGSGSVASGSIIAVPAPEPASAAMLGFGLVGLAGWRRGRA